MKATTLQWLFIGLAVLLLAGLIWVSVVSNKPASQTLETFLTVDTDAVKTQHQQLQLEGERRYNPLARLQASGQKIPATGVDAAITTSRTTPSIGHPGAASLLGLLGTSLGLGAADDGSGKTGEWVEQTGVIQDKINFCESLTTIDCDSLQSDPRMKECGFCHRDGTDSKGKAHRGGLFISADDQIRANVAAEGGQASYQPTIGTCKPMNFTLMATNCKAREAQLQCQAAGAPMTGNPCGQCYGKTPNNATGLLYMTPNKPLRHQVFLNVSHTGFYTGPNGYGLEVTYPNGAVVGMPAATNGTSLAPPASPMPLNVAEGDTLSIKIYGPPRVWCAWLSNQTGTRTVSLDIGVQTVNPTSGMEIAGDKMSGPVTSALGQESGWSAFQATVPNTVLWYARRDEIIAPAVAKAIYGISQSPSQSVDVTATALTQLAKGNGSLQVGPSLLAGGATDPAPGAAKWLWAMLDNGGTQVLADGQTITVSETTVTFNFQMPATLADPPLAADLADCPTGPIVLTEVGAGLMGAHSCFKPDGSFNPTAYCLQELFTAAGGTQQGTDWPATDAAAAKLVAPSGTIDDTVAALNRLGNIAIYGVDQNGQMVDFPTFKDAAMRMLGIAVKNPCDGPLSSTGPHSPECLDYLWRTMNNPGQDATPISGSPPFSGCTATGLSAPLNPDGTVNAQNVAAANAQGGVTGVRSYFQKLYNRTQNTGNFDDQVAAMRDCYGTNIQPPVTPSGTCPPPAGNEWQCYTAEKLQLPEVFAVCPNNSYSVTFKDAESTCASYGARLATPAEVTVSQQAGAQWCSCAWTTDGNAYYPMQQNAPGCGSSGVNSCGKMAWGWVNGTACVNCFGVKPPSGTTDVRGFNTTPDGATVMWNQPQAVTAGRGLDDAHVPACRVNAGQVECLSDDGVGPHWFPTADACNTFATQPEAGTFASKTMNLATQNPTLSNLIYSYVNARV